MPLDTQHAGWIETKVKATLSHYPQNWTEQAEVRDAAIDTWVDFLGSFSQAAIDHALTSHLQSSPRERPTPGGIRAKARSYETGNMTARGDRESLTMDEQYTLVEKTLPTARRWVSKFPPSHSLHQSAKQTLEYWGEAAE
ncbi:MAG: hypothetical protein AAGK79_17360 [Pseudomonadota bacterium]